MTLTDARNEQRQREAKHRAAGNVIELYWMDLPDPSRASYLIAIRNHGMLIAVVNRSARTGNWALAVREALARSWSYEVS